MATLQTTNVTGVLSVNDIVLTGGKDIKYEEFNSSGTFTPIVTGVHQVFLVGGGQRGSSSTVGGCGGEVIETFTTLTSTTGCTVTIGAGGTSNGAVGGDSSVAFSSAGGTDITALGGNGGNAPTGILTSGAGASYNTSVSVSNPGATISTPSATVACMRQYYPSTAYGYQSAYAYKSAYASSNAYSTPAGGGYKGYGAGGAASGGGSGVVTPKANSGAGSQVNVNGGSGYCLIVWAE